MSKHHSQDYKLSIVKYYKSHNKSLREVCDLFNCKYNSLYRWVNRYDEHNNIKRKQTIKKSYKVTKKIETFVLHTIKKSIDITLQQIVKLVKTKFKIDLHRTTILNILKKDKITRKRLRKKYYPQKFVDNKIQIMNKFYKDLKKYHYSKVISIDETSIYINMTGSYGRSKSGRRAILTTTTYPFKKFNLLCAITSKGIVGIELSEHVKGGINVSIFNQFVDKYIDKKYKGYLILLDNAPFHRSKILVNNILKTKNKILNCVPYNPKTNPIDTASLMPILKQSF